MAKHEAEILDDDDAEEMQEELERSAADMERMRKALVEERRISAGLREQLNRMELTEQLDREETRGGGNGGEHVIDLPGRSRRAWRCPNFRLFLLMVAIFSSVVFDAKVSPYRYGPEGLAALCISLFLAWGLGQFRKRGLASVLLKWAVFFPALALCELVRVSSSWGVELGRDWRAIAGGLAVVMLLTFTKISEWLGRQIRLHVWETMPVEIVRGWF